MEINIQEITEKAVNMNSLSFKLNVIQVLHTLKQFQSMRELQELQESIEKILRSC